MNDPPTLFVSNSISFGIEEGEGPIATFDSTGLSMNSNRITDVANPTSDQDAVTRVYVDQHEVPIGTVISFYGNTTPAGYLYCNGASFNQATYPELYSLLGGNVLPDMRGYFMRGTSDSNAVDPSGPRAVGSVQSDEVKSHTHTYLDTYATENTGTNLGYLGHSDPDYDNAPLTISRTTDATGGAETRPKNVAVRFVIKALPASRY